MTLDPGPDGSGRSVDTAGRPESFQANNLTLPGGELPVDVEQIQVSTIGRFDSIEQVEGLVVGVRERA